MIQSQIVNTEEILSELQSELPLFDWSIVPRENGYTVAGKVIVNDEELVVTLFYYFVIDFNIKRFKEEFTYSIAQKIMDWRPG